MDFRLQKDSTLLDLEEELRRVNRNPGAEFTVWLPRTLGTGLFVESRVTSLLAAANREGTLHLRDWVQADKWRAPQAANRFARSVEGIAALKFASKMSNANEGISLSLDEALAGLAARGGVIEDLERPRSAPQSSLTFCSVDHEAPEPSELAGLTTKSRFAARFLHLRGLYHLRAFGAPPADERPEEDQDLATFVYETYQNSLEHGRLDGAGRPMPGVRFLRLRKHVGKDAAALVERAASFPELEQYLRMASPRGAPPSFYEVAVSDHGLGIVERLTASRPDVAADGSLDFNKIVRQALSSKRDQPGAGLGLDRALQAVRALTGFISIRSGSSWLSRGFSDPDEDTITLEPTSIGPGAPARIPGTHVNLLFPVRSTKG